MVEKYKELFMKKLFILLVALSMACAQQLHASDASDAQGATSVVSSLSEQDIQKIVAALAAAGVAGAKATPGLVISLGGDGWSTRTLIIVGTAAAAVGAVAWHKICKRWGRGISTNHAARLGRQIEALDVRLNSFAEKVVGLEGALKALPGLNDKVTMMAGRFEAVQANTKELPVQIITMKLTQEELRKLMDRMSQANAELDKQMALLQQAQQAEARMAGERSGQSQVVLHQLMTLNGAVGEIKAQTNQIAPMHQVLISYPQQQRQLTLTKND